MDQWDEAAYFLAPWVPMFIMEYIVFPFHPTLDMPVIPWDFWIMRGITKVVASFTAPKTLRKSG